MEDNEEFDRLVKARLAEVLEDAGGYCDPSRGLC